MKIARWALVGAAALTMVSTGSVAVWAADGDEGWTEPKCIIGQSGAAPKIVDGRVSFSGWAVCDREIDKMIVTVKMFRVTADGSQEIELTSAVGDERNVQLGHEVTATVDCDGFPSENSYRALVGVQLQDGVENTETFFASGWAKFSGLVGDSC